MIESNKLNTRDLRFDILRVIGLSCIIFAHTLNSSHVILYQLRNFDVPLMVIVSGAVFGITSLNTNINYKFYLRKRILRLLMPTWLFLSFFFMLFYILSFISGYKYPFSPERIIYSYALTNAGGIGYVWIFRVFLIIAVIAPFILKLHHKVKKDIFYFGILFLFYAGYESIYWHFKSTEYHLMDIFFDYLVFYLIPYGCLFGLGLRLRKMSKNSVLMMMLICFALFVSFLFQYSHSNFTPTEDYKYPPTVYYISYAVFVSLLLYLIFDDNLLKILGSNVTFSNVILFVSSSSMTIYLWHILFLYMWNYSFKFRPVWTNTTILSLFIVGGLSILTTYVQSNLMKRFRLIESVAKVKANL